MDTQINNLIALLPKINALRSVDSSSKKCMDIKRSFVRNVCCMIKSCDDANLENYQLILKSYGLPSYGIALLKTNVDNVDKEVLLSLLTAVYHMDFWSQEEFIPSLIIDGTMKKWLCRLRELYMS